MKIALMAEEIELGTVYVNSEPGSGSKDAAVLRSSQDQVGVLELGKRLMIAAQEGDTAMVRELMKNGAPFATDWLGTSSLHVAALGGHIETCELLLRSGILKDAKNKVEKTPLHFAATEGHADVVLLLIEKGADVNVIDMLNMTPLHWAVEREHIETIKVLLQNNANPQFLNKFDKSCFDIATDSERYDILQLLKDGAKEGEYTVKNKSDNVTRIPVVPLPSRQAAQKTVTFVPTKLTTRPMTTIVVPNFPPRKSPTDSSKVQSNNVKEKLVNIDSKGEAEDGERRNDVEEEEEEEDDDEDDDDDADKSRLAAMQLLEEHGIEMLDGEDINLVASAVGNGQTLVLTEAGKQALSLTKEKPPTSIPIVKGVKRSLPVSNVVNKPTDQGSSTKVVRMTAKQLIQNLQSQKSNLPDKKVIRVSSVSDILQNKLSRPLVVQKAAVPSIADMSKKLEAARREALQYKVLYVRKQKEAEEYRNKLQTIRCSTLSGDEEVVEEEEDDEEEAEIEYQTVES